METRNNIIASCANRGNISSVASHTYSWDDADRLTKFDNSTGTDNDAVYAYLPGSGMRYKRTQGATVEYYVYDGDNVVASYAANGTLNARYVTPGLDDNLSETRGGSTYYYMQDGLGSVRNLVDADEATQNVYDYYAFGNALGTETTGVASPYRYTARDYESGGILNMHYYRNRYYLPSIGIFASRDAMWADIHRGWGYVGNRPTYYVDPYGLGPVGDFFDWLAGFFGGGDDAGPDVPTAPVVPGNGQTENADGTTCPGEDLPFGGLPGDEVFNGMGRRSPDPDEVPDAGGGLGVPAPVGQPAIPEAAWETLRHLKGHNWSPPRDYKGGEPFRNDADHPSLPKDGKFKEYDIHRHVRGVDRGNHRLVRDINTNRVWYTPDHYTTFYEMIP